MINHPTVQIRPENKLKILDFGEIWEFRFLLLRLARRDLVLRYRQTVLGVLWVVLQPLLASGVLAFVFGTIANLPSEGVPYYVLSYAGFLGWSAFSAVLAKSTGVLLSNSSLVSKVYFPRILLPRSTIGSTLVDVAVASIVMVVMLVTAGIEIGPRILLVPLLLIGFLVTAAGIGCAAAALAVPYRDIAVVIPVLTQLLLYGSPVAYSLSAVPGIGRQIMRFNPLTGFLEAMRWSLLPGRSLDLRLLLLSCLVASVTLLCGLLVFNKFERNFADVI